MMKNGRYYHLLTRNMIVIIVTLSLTPLILTGVIILMSFSDAYHAKVTEHLGELVQKHSQNIDRFLEDRLADIRVLARSCEMEQLHQSEVLSKKLRLLREEYGGVFVDLGFVNDRGIQTAYAGPFNLTGADYSESAWYKNTIKSEHYISDVFTGLRGTPHFIVAVKQSDYESTWILRATIDFEAFNQLVENIRIGRTGFAFIINRHGEYQTEPRSEVNLADKPYVDFLYGKQRLDDISLMEYTNNRGQKSIVAVAPLKNGQWILCCRQDSEDAFLVFQETKNLAIMVFIISGLVIILVALLLARRMVSHISRADEEKSVMNEKVIEAGRLASIGELAAGIAHEINNPVAIMVEEAGWIEDLIEDDELTGEENLDELKRAVGQIKIQGARCKEITHKLLSFARKTDPAVCEVDLNEIVMDTVSLLRQKTRYANVKIETSLVENLPPIAVSPSEIQQVMLNLLNNAVDAIDADGGAIRLKTNYDGKAVALEITDTGRGIPEAVLGRIFDPFFTTKPVGQGTGLGLSICFGIINKLGGDINVKSQAGQGATFMVSLPAVENSNNNDEPEDRSSDTEELALNA